MIKRITKKLNGRFVEVIFKLDDGCLSITGREGRVLSKTVSITESRGPIHTEIAEFFPEFQHLLPWHLNNLRPGCEHQEKEGWDKRPIDPAKPIATYGYFFKGQQLPCWNTLAWVRRSEHPKGLLGRPCSICGFRYGESWNKRELPPDVMAEIQAIMKA